MIKLDTKGDRIQGALSEMYHLKKMGTDQEIVEKYWKLVELRGKKIATTENRNKEANFRLTTEDNRAFGNGGCHSFNGGYTLSEGNRISFSQTISTQMACTNANYENEFLKVFEQVDNYAIKGDTLSLNKARMAPLARFELVYFR